MRLTDTENAATFRTKARAWLKENAPWHLLDRAHALEFAGEAWDDHHETLRQVQIWQKAKFDAGYACLSWPKRYGGQEFGPIEEIIFREEERPFARFFDYFIIGQSMCASTLAFAEEATKLKLLPRIASGEDVWCQMFSEPQAGSDMAAVRTKAEPVDGGWLINGQKVWTSGAHYCDLGTLLVRTDPDVPKHKGLTMFYLRMDSPGVDVRPIRSMKGSAHFNEVFFDNVFIPDAQRLGRIGEGWKVALVTLNSERLGIGALVPIGFDEILALTRRRGPTGSRAIDRSDVRARLADWYVKTMGVKFGVYRQLSNVANGGEPGPEAAGAKLVGGVATQEMAELALDLLGADGLCPEADDANRVYANMFYYGAQHRIEGGADEILKNVLAEQVLGMPQESRLDREIPFKDIPTGERN
jgi:acyl-CoA dehydrogenase